MRWRRRQVPPDTMLVTTRRRSRRAGRRRSPRRCAISTEVGRKRSPTGPAPHRPRASIVEAVPSRRPHVPRRERCRDRRPRWAVATAKHVDPRQGRPRRGHGVRGHRAARHRRGQGRSHSKGDVDAYSAKVILAREARIISALEHPNIIPIYDAGIDPHARPVLRDAPGHGHLARDDPAPAQDEARATRTTTR